MISNGVLLKSGCNKWYAYSLIKTVLQFKNLLIVITEYCTGNYNRWQSTNGMKGYLCQIKPKACIHKIDLH